MKVLNGTEKLMQNGKELPIPIMEFWAWNSSDLLNNTLRGAYAEYLVSKALELDFSESRIDWDAYDVKYGNVRIEVKSSAYLQAWEQNKPTAIRFSIAPAQAWSSSTWYDGKAIRHSDFYVFCLFACKERKNANPLNLDQWDFYVLPTQVLDQKCGVQKSIAFSALLKLGAVKCHYEEIKAYIDNQSMILGVKK